MSEWLLRFYHLRYILAWQLYNLTIHRNNGAVGCAYETWSTVHQERSLLFLVNLSFNPSHVPQPMTWFSFRGLDGSSRQY